MIKRLDFNLYAPHDISKHHATFGGWFCATWCMARNLKLIHFCLLGTLIDATWVELISIRACLIFGRDGGEKKRDEDSRDRMKKSLKKFLSFHVCLSKYEEESGERWDDLTKKHSFLHGKVCSYLSVFVQNWRREGNEWRAIRCFHLKIFSLIEKCASYSSSQI